MDLETPSRAGRLYLKRPTEAIIGPSLPEPLLKILMFFQLSFGCCRRKIVVSTWCVEYAASTESTECHAQKGVVRYTRDSYLISCGWIFYNAFPVYASAADFSGESWRPQVLNGSDIGMIAFTKRERKAGERLFHAIQTQVSSA